MLQYYLLLFFLVIIKNEFILDLDSELFISHFKYI